MKVYGLEFNVVKTQDNQVSDAVNANYKRYYKLRKPNLQALKNLVTGAGVHGAANTFGINV